jgi:hypothetical protein
MSLETQMTAEQRTPDELIAENQLICAKLLGWTPDDGGWIKQDGYMYGGCGTPSFTTWADAGLILDSFQQRGVGRTVWQENHPGEPNEMHRFFVSAQWERDGKVICVEGSTGPLAVRAAALAYIRSLP